MLNTPRPSAWEDEPQWDEIDADSDEAREAREEYEDADPGEMDGDAASALASVGWGTDEDYGCDEM